MHRRRNSLPTTLINKRWAECAVECPLPAVAETEEVWTTASNTDGPIRRRSNTTPPEFLSAARQRVLSVVQSTPRLNSLKGTPYSLTNNRKHVDDDSMRNFHKPSIGHITGDNGHSDSAEDIRMDTPRPNTPFFENHLQPHEGFRPKATTWSSSSCRKRAQDEHMLPPLANRKGLAHSVECITIVGEETVPIVPLPPILKKSCTWVDNENQGPEPLSSGHEQSGSKRGSHHPVAGGLNLRIHRDPLPVGSEALREVLQQLDLGEECDQGKINTSSDEENPVKLRAPKALGDLQQRVEITAWEKQAVHKCILLRDGCSYYIGSRKMTCAKDRRRVRWQDDTCNEIHDSTA